MLSAVISLKNAAASSVATPFNGNNGVDAKRPTSKQVSVFAPLTARTIGFCGPTQLFDCKTTLPPPQTAPGPVLVYKRLNAAASSRLSSNRENR